MESKQMLMLKRRYGVDTKRELLRAVRDELNDNTWEPGDGPRYTLIDAEILLDRMLDAEYQRIEAGVYEKV